MKATKFKTISIILLELFLVSCASKRASESEAKDIHFTGVFFEEKGNRPKKLILRFSPEVPNYEIIHKSAHFTEIKWSAQAKKDFKREFVFNEPGLNKAEVLINSEKERGMLAIWHDGPTTFEFVKGGTTDFLLGADEMQRSVASLKEKEGRGRRINLSVKGAPIDKVIRTLAAEADKSVVAASNVTGNVSVTLQNLTYEQAIDMVLRPTPYRAEFAGDVTIIRSAKDDKTFRAFKVRYVDVNTLLEPIKAVASKDAQVSVDANTNSIFIVDRFEIVKNIEGMIAAMDEEPRQVEVETALLEVDKRNNLDYGFDWAGNIRNIVNGRNLDTSLTTSNISPLNRTDPNVQGAFFGLSYQSVNGILGALAQKGKMRMLARPKIVALTDQEANILLGSKLGYKTVEQTNQGALESINFLTIGTQLKIKAHITQTNDILMYLKPEVSDGSVDPKTGLPSETTTSAETRVLAKNGMTIVIGGLYRDRLEKTINKIPILGDIPLVGFFFSSFSENVQKNEVIVLLAPKVVTSEMLDNYTKDGKNRLLNFYQSEDIEIPKGRVVGHE